MQQAVAFAVIIGIASGLTGAWLLQREEDRRVVAALNGRSRRTRVAYEIPYLYARQPRSTTETPATKRK